MNNYLAVVFAVMTLSGCTCETVHPGNVGVLVHMMGGDKGVDHEVVGVGRHYLGINEELYVFPTFEQNPKYTQSDNDSGNPINFQTKEGMVAEADFSITYTIDKENVATVFQKYRLGIEEINRGPLRNILRDCVNEVSSKLSVEDVYGAGKVEMVDVVERMVKERAIDSGIKVSRVSLLGAMRLPEQVVAALNSKIEATQKAMRAENELKEAEAEGRKRVAAATADAQARFAQTEGEAKSRVAAADAEAKANKLLADSLTPQVLEFRRVQIEQQRIEKWNGVLPSTILGGTNNPMLMVGGK